VKNIVLGLAVSLLTFVSFHADAWSQVYDARSDLFFERNLILRQMNYDPDKIHQRNLQYIKEFIQVDVEKNPPENPFDPISDAGKAQYLNPNIAHRVLGEARRHPVVSFYAYNKYDPENLGIGFCFGRAMYTHLELLYRGFDRESVKKAFVIGPMKTGDGNRWAWHVSTIAQSWAIDHSTGELKEVWLAIDPITQLQTLTEWYREMRKDFSTDGKLALFITEPGMFGPDSYYTQRAISDPFYNDYFIDLFDKFEKDSRNRLRRYLPENYIEEYQPSH
jgi:hypothetical protein